jgi:hypothetical protein
MKKIITAAIALVLMVSVANATPDSKVLQRFKETFPNAQNVKWLDDKDGYLVSFTQNGNLNKVVYDTEGNFTYALKYYGGEGLPTNVAMSLSKNYGESKIIGVTEVTTQNNAMYDVKLSKGNKLYCLKVSSDGSIAKQEVFKDGTAN